MKLLTSLLVLGTLVVPVQAATTSEVVGTAYMAGQLVCTLRRHGAPESVIRLELQRLGAAVATDLGVQFSDSDAPAIQAGIDAVMKTCPPAALPDA